MLIDAVPTAGRPDRSASWPACRPCRSVITPPTAECDTTALVMPAAKRMPQVPGPAPRISGSAATTSSAAEQDAADLATLNHSLVGSIRARSWVISAPTVTAAMTITGGRK